MRQVLIIDDERVNLLRVKSALKKLLPDCNCHVASFAEEGIDLAEKINPDCILLDIVLPKSDGFQVLKTLKASAQTKHIPVILVSGIKKDTQSRIKALDLGADAFISKPCDYEELAALIRVMFRIKDAEEKLNKQLSESNLKYKEVIDLQHNGLVIYDVKNKGKDFIIAEFNPKAEEIENIKKEEVIGKNVLDAFPLAKEFGIVDTFMQVYKTGKPSRQVFTFMDKNGIVNWRENYIYKISSGQIVAVYKDITERKQAELDLNKSETKYRLLADYNYAWEYWKNAEGNYNYVSPACLNVSGYTAKEFMENPELIIKISHPEDKEKIALHYKEENQKTGEHEFEYKIIRADGTERWILHKCRPIYTEQGKFLGRRGINKDVTDYKAAIESVELLKKAVESSNDIFFITDINNIFTYVNAQFTKTYGYSSEEVLGKYAPNTILGTGDKSEPEHEYILSQLEDKQSITVEYRNKRKNGKLIDVHSLTDPILDEKGHIIGFLSIQRDISKRNRADKIQKIILNISNEANKQRDLKKLLLFIQKELSSVIDTSNSFVALYDEEKDLISLPFIEGKESQLKSFPPGKTFTSWVIRNNKPLLATSEIQKELEQKGEVEILGLPAAVWLGVPLKIEGKVTGVFVVQNYEDTEAYNTDDLGFMEIISNQISHPIERIQKEKALLKALDQAQESDRLKSAFLATMSHELRTPLNAINGFSGLIDKDTSTEEVLMFCERINSSGNHLLELINEMFELSLIEADKVKLSPSHFSLSGFLSAIYSTMQIEKEKLDKEKVEFYLPTITTDYDLYIDKNKLSQVFYNLIKNALKYTNEGLVEFGYQEIKEDTKRMLRFYVKDTGIGIPKAKRDIIFDPFRQADDSHTRLYGGVGIGLSVAKKLVQLLGGKIYFDSEEGKGSCFYFTIPL